MDTMIKEINDNLNTIIDNLKENKDTFSTALDNIQSQMDKKVEEAKKYKIQVDESKDRIRALEDDNKALESSLNELNDKYGKMNLVSIIEAGNREIKSKINDNLISINREKEHIAELTNKAREIKDLLISLKKDKTSKEEKLSNLTVIYDYYFDRINEITDYAFNHANNLSDYKSVNYNSSYDDDIKDVNYENNELENTMVFDEIANIDDNKDFKDEMTFISDQAEENNDNFNSDVIDTPTDTTQVFDTIFNVDDIDGNENTDSIEEKSNIEENINDDIVIDDKNFVHNEEKEEDLNIDIDNSEKESDFSFNIEDNGLKEEEIDNTNIFETNTINTDDVDNAESNEGTSINNDIEFNENDNLDEDTTLNEESNFETFNVDTLNDNKEPENNLDEISTDNTSDESNIDSLDIENEERINKINDLFSSIDNVKTTTTIPANEISSTLNNNIEDKIDDAYKDVFGKDINEETINESPTLTDIFGNPIKKEDISNEVKLEKQVEELFSENGLDFGLFKEDEKNYLKQIYNEEKFNKIFSVLKNNNINLNNIYKAFNIFGEISPEELESVIVKLLNVGQSVEAIGIILEKMPKIKKYNLDEAITSFGEYIKDVDITELIIKAKELYDGGNN